MKIAVSEYELYPLGQLSALRGPQPKRGCLLRLTKDGSQGYADLCPLTEYGDLSLAKQLESLASGTPTALAQQSLYLAEKDLIARKEKRSLYGDAIIRNHFLVKDILEFDIRSLPQLAIQGFHHIKFKMGRQLSLEKLMLEEVMSQLISEKQSRIKLRLDFNGTLNYEKFKDFLASLSEEQIRLIEFIEDPFAFDESQWLGIQKEFKVSLAVDFNDQAFQTNGDAFDVLVLKPARQDYLKIAEQFSDKKIVVTHTQDFLVGQLHALAAAYELKSKNFDLLTCGLQLVDTFEPSVFQSLVDYNGDQILPPKGSGIGLDQDLEQQEWTAL